ncbi:MAG: sulfatase-like hydrolase/transferase, partial [Nitrospiraceae bacterium]|nr:sulfatase-like hydrolase/transferase [Nitrospiraceae bacterium]
NRGLSLNERLLPEFLKEQGYVCGIIGKWHLGRGKDLEYMPTRRGFDSFFGHPGGAMDYWTHKDQSGEEVLYRGLEKVREEGYATDLFGEEAIRYVKRNRSRPFFLYLPFNAPHTPLQTPDAPFEPIDDLMKPRNIPDGRARHVKMVERLDEKVGDLLQALEKLGLADNTLVIFTSDNGGAEYSGRNLPLKGHKVALLEGGQRVPFIARWPGRIPAGTHYDGLSAGMDLFTTLIEVAGGSMPTDRTIDGVSLIPYLTGRSQENAHEWLAWESHNDKFVRRGYRKGPWKLRMMRSVAEAPEKTPIELYNLSSDLGEHDNLVQKRPDKLKELLQELAVWEHDVGIRSMIHPPKTDGAQSNESIVPGP